MTRQVVWVVTRGERSEEVVRVFSDETLARAYADIENEGRDRFHPEWHEVDDLWLDTELPSHVRVWTRWCGFSDRPVMWQNADHEGSKIVWDGGFVPEKLMVKSRANKGAYWLSVEGVNLTEVRAEYACERERVMLAMDAAAAIKLDDEIAAMLALRDAR